MHTPQGSYERLCLDVGMGRKMDVIRQIYNPKVVTSRPCFRQLAVLAELLPQSLFEPKSVPEYAVALLKWLVDDCGVSPGARVMDNMTMLEWICLKCYMLPATEMAWFLLGRMKHAAASTENLDQCLLHICLPPVPPLYLQYRLLDAGATPRLLDADNNGNHRDASRMYQDRRRCQHACWALLSLARKSALVRRCTPRDIMLIIARQVWNRRFSYPWWRVAKK